MTDPAQNDQNPPENVVPIQDGKSQPQGEPTVAPFADAARLATLEAEVATYKDQALRALAEVENTRRRAAKEREDAMKYGTTALAKELLGVSDNLRRALDAAGGDLDEKHAKNLVVGVEATERQLLSAFERVGIAKIEPIGQLFDPNFHRVMQEAENTGQPAGTVVQVLQAGYMIHDRLLREALVVIAKGANGQGAGGSVNQTA